VRKGGTALGGGTIVGLGAALLGTSDFQAVCSLAEQGSHESIDLLVRDIYPEPDSPIKGDLTAASFGRLGRAAGETRPQDMACAVMRLVGENVALIAGGLARNSNLARIIYGGSTLRKNPALARVLEEVTGLLGLEARILEDGEFAGALGAMEWAPRTDRF
jgi:type II pantothenate kinase